MVMTEHRLARVLDDEEHLVEESVVDVQRVVEADDRLEAIVTTVGLDQPRHRFAVQLEAPDRRREIRARHPLAREDRREPWQNDARRECHRRAAEHRRVLKSLVVAQREIPAGQRALETCGPLGGAGILLGPLGMVDDGDECRGHGRRPATVLQR